MIRKIVKVCMNFSKQMTQKNISSFAASTAFFLFISLIPIMYLICSIIPYTIVTEESLQMIIEEAAPNVVGAFIVSILSDIYAKSAGVISVSVVIMIWSAGKGVMGLMRGLNAINNVPENRNYFIVRIISAFYTVIMIVAMFIAMVFLGLGKSILDIVRNSIPGIHVLWFFAAHFRFLFSLLLLTFFFTMVYTYLPNRKLVFHLQIPGAFFSALVWSIFSWGFSVYLDYFNGFRSYGSLTTIIIVMLWMYFMMYIMMIGAHINRYFGPVYEFFYHKIKMRRVHRKQERVEKVQELKSELKEEIRNRRKQE